MACAAYAGGVENVSTGGASPAWCIAWCITAECKRGHIVCVCGAASGTSGGTSGGTSTAFIRCCITRMCMYHSAVQRRLCCVRRGEARADAQPVARERPAHEAPFARTERHEHWRQSERLQYVNTGPIWPARAAGAADWPRLAGAWGSPRRDLALRGASGAPAGRGPCHLVFGMGDWPRLAEALGSLRRGSGAEKGLRSPAD